MSEAVCLRCEEVKRDTRGDRGARWVTCYEHDPRTQALVEAHAGYGMTLEQVAQEFGVCRERIRQIEATALAKLQKRITRDPEVVGR